VGPPLVTPESMASGPFTRVVIMSVLILVIGVKVLGDGLGKL
jgi:hypothetical protein